MWLLPDFITDKIEGGIFLFVVIVFIVLGFKMGFIRILIWLVTKLMK